MFMPLYRVFYVLHELSQKEIEKLPTKEKTMEKVKITYSKKRKVEDVEAVSVEDAIRWAENQRVELTGYPGVYGQFVSVYGAKEALEGAKPDPDTKLTFEELLLPL